MKRRLLVKLSSLGDVVCALPVATALKSTFPSDSVVWAVDPRFKGIVDCCKAIDLVVPVAPKLSPSTWPQFNAPFDAVLDLQGLAKSGLVTMRAKAPIKLGYHWQRELSYLASKKVPRDPSSVHIVDQYLDVAVKAGAQRPQTADFGLVPFPEDLVKMQDLVSAGSGKLGFIAVNPGSAVPAKRWNAERLGELCQVLEELDYGIVVLGGKAAAEIELAESVRRKTKSGINMAGKTTVRQLVALLSLAECHIGGDTGTTHIAAAQGIPCVGLYGPTDPDRSSPYNKRESCVYHRGNLSTIQVDEVFEKFKIALNQ